MKKRKRRITKDGKVKFEQDQNARMQDEHSDDRDGVEPSGDDAQKEQIVRDILEDKGGADAAPEGAEQLGSEHAQEPTVAEAQREDEQVSISAKELEALKQKAEQAEYYMDRYQRARADYINLQNRVERNRQAWTELAIRDLALALLGVLDHLQLALNAEAQDQNLEAFVEGVRLIEKQLYKVLADHQIEPIKAEGEEFDPQYHEAVLQEYVEDGSANVVLEELQRGFTLCGKVLRPSKVKVSARRETPAAESNEEDR